MRPSDEAVIKNLHAIKTMMELGLQPEWVAADVQPYVRSAASLSMRGTKIAWPAIRLLSGGSIDQEVGEIFGTDGIGPQDAVSLARTSYTKAELAAILNRMSERLKKGEPYRDWLPLEQQRLGAILRDGSAYDPTPSSHFKSKIPQVEKKLGCFLDGVFRGGVYSGVLGIIAAIPGHGKSTMAYTIAGWCVNNGFKVAFISGEETEQYIAMRVLMVQTGASEEQAFLFQKFFRGEDSGDELRALKRPDGGTMLEYMHVCLMAQDKYLQIYNQEHGMDLAAMDGIMAWFRPDVLIIDHMMMVGDAKAKKSNNDAFDIGNRIYQIREMVVQKYQVQGIVFSQLPESDARKMASGKKIKYATMYGSGMVNQASHWTALLSRHPDRRNVAKLWYQKSKIGTSEYGIEDEYEIDYSPRTLSFSGGRLVI